MVSQRELVKIYNQGLIKTPKARFDISDLVGETIESHEGIDRESRNKNHTYPGRYLEVIHFQSGKILMIGVEGHHDSNTTHSYLVEVNGRTRYSDHLFRPDRRAFE